MRPMRLILIFMLFISMNSFAMSEAHCELVNGIYDNSSKVIHDIKFSTLVDIFNLTNAHTLSMNLDGEELKLLRSEMIIKRIPRLTYKLTKKNKILKTVFIMLDRAPKEISESKEFYGNMIIPYATGPINDEEISTTKSLVYNFYCRF